MQFQNPSAKGFPTTYYGPDSGVGRLLRVMQADRASRRVGIVGLGVGTLAAYGVPGDRYRFYEINEDVIRLAEQHFTYLGNSGADVEMVLGDARLSMEAESPREYDLLVLDAFAGDAVPTHLLTREALDVYLKHLADDGVLAIHISNLHFDLRPVVDALADEGGLHAITVKQAFADDDPSGQRSSEWALLSRDAGILQTPRIAEAAAPPQADRVHWTDQYSNLFGILR
jgi:hypothetical protein